MLGDPKSLVPEPLGRLRQSDAACHGIRVRRAMRAVGQVEDIQGHGS
jgi:hypothetical protein